jgi:hypothetical protein
MSLLIFKNKKLQEILRITETANTFRTTFAEAINAYEIQSGKSYQYSQDIDLHNYGEQNTPTIWLVKDWGIYLMTSAKTEFPKDTNHVCYAEGYEPDAPDSYERCRDAAGGNDFVQSIPFPEDMQQCLREGADIEIEISAETFEIMFVHS